MTDKSRRLKKHTPWKHCLIQSFCFCYNFQATRPGGCIALVGLRSNEAVFPLVDTVLKEIKMIGISVYANRFPTTLEMLASGKKNYVYM